MVSDFLILIFGALHSAARSALVPCLDKFTGLLERLALRSDDFATLWKGYLLEDCFFQAALRLNVDALLFDVCPEGFDLAADLKLCLLLVEALQDCFELMDVHRGHHFLSHRYRLLIRRLAARVLLFGHLNQFCLGLNYAIQFLRFDLNLNSTVQLDR